MRVEDEPLNDFYPRCCVCGCLITTDGYQFGDQYCCDDCAKSIDGEEIAYERRDSAFEDAKERFNAE